jgi:4-amino-4-deoxychorismate lyase
MQESGLDCRVIRQNINALFAAQEMFVCNSLMVLVPVVGLFNPANQQSHCYTMEQTKQLQHFVHQTISAANFNSSNDLP